MSAAIDVHQHVWPEALLGALARRRTAPLLRRDGREGWLLRIAGEPEGPVDPADHDPVLRAALMGADGLDLAVVAPSSPRGSRRCPPTRPAASSGPTTTPWGSSAPAGADLPSWWPALTSYVAQMQAAWLAFRAWGRPATRSPPTTPRPMGRARSPRWRTPWAPTRSCTGPTAPSSRPIRRPATPPTPTACAPWWTASRPPPGCGGRASATTRTGGSSSCCGATSGWRSG